VREVLAVGGFDVVAPGAGSAAVVCAPDALFATEVPTVLEALRKRGVPAFVAGKPGASETALRGAGAIGFIAMGQDVPAFAAAVRASMRGAS
jgi:methylmalonyl-CoA mutase cobalamin-binding subunit